MKRVAVGLCALLTVAGVLVGPQLFSQETKSTTKADVKKAEGKKEVKGRLPDNYGKLELTDEQKTSVYDIQAKYMAEIAALQAQLDGLKAKQATEVKGVLTPGQIAKLAEIEAESAKKKALKKAEAAKSTKTEAPKVDTTKVDTTKKPETKTTDKK